MTSKTLMHKSSTKRILNCIPSRDVHKDWRIDSAVGVGLIPPVKIPDKVDLREPWWKVNDQGSTGSCVGWASTDALLRWHLAKVNKIGKAELLSVRFIWMAAKETDMFINRPTTFIEPEGTSPKAALDIARKYGVVKDSVLPFGSGVLYPGIADDFYAIAAQLKISSYFNLGLSLADWRKWIATVGPILTRLDVDSTWDNASNTKGNLDKYNPASTRGGHAVALVGYTPDGFIVRNSWGTVWGDKGFGYASDKYAQAAFTEAYGISL
jgi:hypothetical protein